MNRNYGPLIRREKGPVVPVNNKRGLGDVTSADDVEDMFPSSIIHRSDIPHLPRWINLALSTYSYILVFWLDIKNPSNTYKLQDLKL